MQPAAPKLPAVAEVPHAIVSTDPTPSPADLGKTIQKEKQASWAAKPSPAQTSPAPAPLSEALKRPQHAYDTLFHFAAIELEGKLQKN